ncbi:hypothetical protein JCM12141A_35620 [Mycolicibacterium hodleri]
MAAVGVVALPVTESGSRRVAAKSVSESDVPSGVAGTCPAGAALVAVAVAVVVGTTDDAVSTATALVTADTFGVVRASTEVDVTPVDSPDGVCVFEACVAAEFERAVVAGRWLVGAGRWLPVVPASRWLTARAVELDEFTEASVAAASKRPVPAAPVGVERGADEAGSEALADCDLGPAPDVDDDSLDDDAEDPPSAPSAWAIPAVAIAVPIPKATARAPILPMSNELGIVRGFASPGVLVRNAADDDFRTDISDPWLCRSGCKRSFGKHCPAAIYLASGNLPPAHPL